jgi:DNA-binding NtrC family response regulator
MGNSLVTQYNRDKKGALIMRSRILFLSGRQNDASVISEMLHELPLTLDAAGGLQEARTKLLLDEYQMVLTEAELPDGNWLDVLHLVRSSPQDIQVIVTSAHADAALWAEALNLGVYDVLAQPFYEPEVRRILSNACSRQLHSARPIARGMAAV